MLISAPDIIKQSWYFYARHWKKLLPYMLALFIPNIILGLSGIISLYLDKYVNVGYYVLLNNIIVAVIFVASILFTLWATIALTQLLKNLIVNQPTAPLRENLSVNSALIWPVIYTTVLIMLIVAGGTLLLIVPGIIFSVWYAFGYYAVIFDKQKGRAALKYSKGLVTGRWWAMLWRLVVPALFYGMILIIINYIFSYGLTYILSGAAYTVTTGFLTSIISVLAAPLTAFTGVILYLSAKENPIPAKTPPINNPPTL